LDFSQGLSGAVAGSANPNFESEPTATPKD